MSDGDPALGELEGLAWWRALTDTARVYWLEIAKGTLANPSPIDAWAASKRVADRAGLRNQQWCDLSRGEGSAGRRFD